MVGFAWGLSARGTPFYGVGSSLVIDIGSLLDAGRPISLDDTVVIPPFGSLIPQRARAVLELCRVERGLQIDGAIDVEVAGECDRCLDAVVLPIHIEVDERFEPRGGPVDALDDSNVLNGSDLDVSDLVRQLVTAALPLGFICSDDCRGLCPVCGQSKNAGGDCHCPEMEGNDGES